MNVIKVGDSTEAIIVDSGFLSRCFGVTRRHVRQLAKDEIAVRVASGRYDLIQSLRNYHGEKHRTFDEARLESLELDVEEKKLNLAKEYKQVAWAEDYVISLDQTMSGIRKLLEGFKDSVARDCPTASEDVLDCAEKTSHQIQEKITRLIRNAGKIDVEQD